jgi:glycosyltransferase involved in cell wall biosynthesis
MEIKNKRVLVIAYHYPPLAGAGMLKTLRTTRYLAKYGWQPLVLTVKNPESYHRAANPIPEGVQVYRSWRIPGGNLLARILRRIGLDDRWLLLPDQHILWVPGAFIVGLYLIIRKKVDLIYVTGPPYSALIAGAALKRVTGKPLVVEVRDPWSFNAARQGYPSRIHRWLDHSYERWVLKSAALITCIYHITADGYQDLYPWSKDKITVFYDTVDLGDLPQEYQNYSIFTLTYLGTFYPPFATLKATLMAIKTLMDQGVITPTTFCFNYVGPLDKTFSALADSLGVSEVVHWTGYKTLKEAQLEVFKSQALLLLLEFATINTKLFDYLASGKMILAVVPEFTELRGLLERYAASYNLVADQDDRKIAEILKQCYNDFYQKKLVNNPVKTELFKKELNIEAETRDLVDRFNIIHDMQIKDRR